MGLIEKTSTARPAILVLGMAQSGAPGLARALVVALSETGAEPALPARRSRRKSFFELARTAALNAQVMAVAGAPAEDWQPLDPAWFGSAAAKTLRARAQGLIAADFPAQAPVVVEDPRLARFLPFWIPALRTAGIRLPAVHIHRCPDDSARAIQEQRGLARDAGLLQWLSFTLEAETATRGTPRAFLAFDTLGDGTASPDLSRIDAALGLGLTPSGKAAPARPAKATRWTALPEDLPAPVATVAAILDRWCATGEDTRDHPRLDQARRLVHSLTSGGDGADTAPVLLRALGHPDDGAAPVAAHLARMRKPDLVRLAQALARANAALAAPSPDPAAAPIAPQDALARRDRELAHFATLLREAEAAPAGLRAELSRAETHLAHLRRRLDAALADTERLSRETHGLHRRLADDRDAAEAEKAALQGEIAELHQLVARVHGEREAVINSRVWRATAPLRWLLGLPRPRRRP